MIERGICDASRATVIRWLASDAIRPWRHRSWIFPTDPDFAAKAAPILDLYAGRFEGRLLHPGEFVISADEKPSIQARRRVHPSLPATPGVPRGQRVEHSYRLGTTTSSSRLCETRKLGGFRSKLHAGSDRVAGGFFELV